MSGSGKTSLTAAGLLVLVAIASFYFWWMRPAPTPEQTQEQPKAVSEKTSSASKDNSSAVSKASNPSLSKQNGRGSNPPGSSPGVGDDPESTRNRVENGQLDNEVNFTRAVFFTPVEWGPQNLGLQQKEKQSLLFKPACKTHKRATPASSHPTDWAEPFTHSDGQSRWPSSTSHVVDWNQYWTLRDKGIQISIRWNFEMPPKYSVLGYSFALSNPDGYGTALWPEKPEMSWEEAKNFILDWEKKTLDAGGKPGTRTMSLAEKPFNPGEVSTEEIERAEYSNGRVRAAQSGKMLCNSKPNSPEELSCSCWF
ncbi:hypothetical protein EBR21_10650 [bacterium]|nr:hypothetical protein [bacterium]